MVLQWNPTAWAMLVLSGMAVVATAFAAEPDAGPGPRVEYRGAVTLPETGSDARGVGVPLTGLSGITWLGEDGYAAVMDNSRCVVRLRLSLAADGTPRRASDLAVLTLATQHDYEDIAPRAGNAPALFVCEEDTPAIRIFRLTDGAEHGTLPLPPIFRNRRPNRGPEALALDPDGRHLWTANEEALATDGPAAAPGTGTVVRLVRLPLDPSRPARQIAYAVDPPHPQAALMDGSRLSGVVAMVALARGRLLVLERSAGPGLPPFENRLYLVDTAAATDVSPVGHALSQRREAVVPKRLVWSDALGINLEGLCLGPRLGDGRRALVGIADHGGLGTPTAVTGFEMTAVTTP